MEAYLLCDGTVEEEEEEEEYQMKNLSKLLKTIASLKWDLNDTIVLYETDTISYYTLEGFNELNFITYNKEAHFI